jgi:hypothetical protein
MDIRLGPVQPDSSRYSESPSKRAKRAGVKNPHDEEKWSERSDYEEIEDFYTPASSTEESAE